MSSIKVAVRVRPFNRREIELESQCCISVQNATTTIFRPDSESNQQHCINSSSQSGSNDSSSKNASKSFTFDYSYWSFNNKDSHFASQAQVYSDIGFEMLEHALQGYNVCIIAYGQTGAGKSYTMMGGSKDEDLGLIPRFCNELFQKLPNKSKDLEHTVEVSYMEIYMERVRDLLNPDKNKTLKVKYHPLGSYVEDLTKLVVTSYNDIKDCIELGNKSRTVASTRMNDTSSRSHAIFTINVMQKQFDEGSQEWMEKVSKVSLVDLAGSERVESTQAEGLRLKEGSNINTSLFILAKVISALAKNEKFIPYRESVLTTLLKENLGGNSKTAMISAISPAYVNYDETLNTLKYANRTKKIQCKAVINENATAKRLRDLINENNSLKQMLKQMLEAQSSASMSPIELSKLHEFLAQPDSFVKFNSKELSMANSSIKAEISGKSDESNSDEIAELSNESKSTKSEQVENKYNQTEEDQLFIDKPTTNTKTTDTIVASDALVERPDQVLIDPTSAIEQLKQSEKLIMELQETYEEKLRRTEAIKLKLTERETILAEKVTKKWMNCHSLRLRNQLWEESARLGRMIDFAQKRGKNLKLSFVLKRHTLYSTSNFYPLDKPLSELTSLDTVPDETSCSPNTRNDDYQSSINVEINDLSTGAVSHWPLDKFHQRFDLIQKINANRLDLIDIDQFDEACKSDPFYDRHPFCTLIGRSYLYLSNLLYPMTMIQRIPIVNEYGDVKGYLRVVTQAVRDNEELGDVPEMGSIIFNVEQSAKIDFNDDDSKFLKIEREIDDTLDDLMSYRTCPTLRTTKFLNDESYSPNIETQSDKKNSSSFDTYSRKKVFVKYPSIESIPDKLNSKFYPNESYTKQDILYEENDKSETGTNSNSFDEKISIESSNTSHLKLGSQFTFRVTVLHAVDLPKTYSEIFCQYSFMHNHDQIFSTKPVKNTRPPSGFFSVQNITVKVTNSLINYLKYHPLSFEVFGQNQSHPSLREHKEIPLYPPLNDSEKDNISQENFHSYAKRQYSQVSAVPILPTKFKLALTQNVSSHVQARYDLLVWFEICELVQDSDGYHPVAVDRSDQDPQRAAFLLHQGIQRKIFITIVHDEDQPLKFTNAREILIGRIRTSIDTNNFDVNNTDIPGSVKFNGSNNRYSQNDENCISLTIFSAKYVKSPYDSQMLFRIETNWDSSLHNTTLLNKLTPPNNRVFLTLSAYIDVKDCCQPAVITKDISVMIVKRENEAAKFLSYANRDAVMSLFSSTPVRNTRCNHMTSIYEIVLLRATDTGSPKHKQGGKLKRFISSSRSTMQLKTHNLKPSMSIASFPSNLTRLDEDFEEVSDDEYGERNWYCRIDPQRIIDDHQWILEKILRLSEAEKTRHHLLVREKLDSKVARLENGFVRSNQKWNPSQTNLTKSNSLFNLISQTMSKSSTMTSLSNLSQSQNSISDQKTDSQVWFMTLEERTICMKYLDLITRHLPTNSTVDINTDDSSCVLASKSSSSDNMKPNHENFDDSWFDLYRDQVNKHLKASKTLPIGLLVPEMEEVRLSPIVSKRGYLNYMDDRDQKWAKRWFIVVRPYMIVFSNSREILERDLINLTFAQIEIPEVDLNLGYVFTLITSNRLYLMHTDSSKDLYDWIYAINPLLAGQIKSKHNAKSDEELFCM